MELSMAEFKKAGDLLSVSLRKNQLSDKDDSYVGSVTRNKVTLENLIASAAEKNHEISSYTLQHSAFILGDEIIAAVRSGKAVDFFGVGTLSIYVDGSVSGQNPDGTSIPGFRFGFSPSQKAQGALTALKVDKVVFSDSAPVFDRIINSFSQENDVLKKGKGVHIYGNRLKVFGDDSGIWFAPIESDGTVAKDESKWIAVVPTTVSINQPKHLEFYVPETEEMAEGQYSIVIRTRYLGGERTLKKIQTSFSPHITVK